MTEPLTIKQNQGVKTLNVISNVLAEISRERPIQFANADGFMLTAYGCAVFENELDDGRFEYTAQNLSSGVKLTLERRKHPVTSSTVEGLVRKLRESKVAGQGRLELSSDAPVTIAKLRNILKELFRDILPEHGYSVRESQIDLAEQLLDAITGRQTLVGEASTGLGKTLVYIVVGALIKRSAVNRTWSASWYPDMSVIEWKRMPILISTSSIALQKSVLLYIREVSRILEENGVISQPLRASLKKGRRNYVCEHNLRSYLPFERNPGISEALNNILLRGDIDLAETDGLTQHIKGVIGVPARCYKNCPYKTVCSYIQLREAHDDAEFDFIVTNHNMLLMDAKMRSEGKGRALPPSQMLVIDEAHQLTSAASSVYGTQLSVSKIPDIARKLTALNFSPKPRKDSRGWRDVREASQILAEQLTALNEELFSRPEADAYCDGILRRIRSTSGYLQKVLTGSHMFNVNRDEDTKYRLIGELQKLAEDADALSDHNEQLRWFERDKDSDDVLALYGLPKRLNDRIYSDLWKRGVPAFLTSGTLSAAGDFSAFKRSTGADQIERLVETVLSSPYDFKKNCLLYLSRNVPYPKQRDKSYIEALTDEVERLILTAHGHSAVLFTSYNVMGRVYRKLQKRGLPFPLFKLERSTSSAIEQFKESRNGVLFATGALWEGIDVPGDTLSMLIIAKLPFAAPDRISEYEQTLYSSFIQYLDSVITPEMLVKLKQGFGRLIRTMTDTGVVAILDIRAYFDGAYHVRIVEALPTCRITDSINDVGGFFEEMKPEEYFESTKAG